MDQFLREQNIDVALINETHLKPNKSLNIPNYTTHRTDRSTTKGGGTAVLVKKHIKHEPAYNDTNMTHLETTSITLEINNKRTKLTAIYNAPKNELIETDIKTLLRDGLPTIAAGDLNAKHTDWGSTCINKAGKNLQRLSENQHFTVAAPPEATHYTKNSSDVLDIALIKDIGEDYQLQVLDELSSDHLPVILTLQGSNTTRTINRMITNWSIYKKNYTPKSR